MDDVVIYSVGLVAMSVCVADGVPREEIERIANARHPTGIGSRWQISEDTTFRGGEPMPAPCDQEPDRKHWLVNC